VAVEAWARKGLQPLVVEAWARKGLQPLAVEAWARKELRLRWKHQLEEEREKQLAKDPPNWYASSTLPAVGTPAYNKCVDRVAESRYTRYHKSAIKGTFRREVTRSE